MQRIHLCTCIFVFLIDVHTVLIHMEGHTYATILYGVHGYICVTIHILHRVYINIYIYTSSSSNHNNYSIAHNLLSSYSLMHPISIMYYHLQFFGSRCMTCYNMSALYHICGLYIMFVSSRIPFHRHPLSHSLYMMTCQYIFMYTHSSFNCRLFLFASLSTCMYTYIGTSIL